MPVLHIFQMIIVFLIIPALGVYLYRVILGEIKEDFKAFTMETELFAVFANYGILLLLFLTTAFWGWSGMSSLGVFYLILVAPVMMLYIAYKGEKFKSESKYYMNVAKAAGLYFLIAPIILILMSNL